MARGVNRSIGMLLLGLWLILTGISGFISLGLPSAVMSLLALIAGILLLIGA